MNTGTVFDNRKGREMASHEVKDDLKKTIEWLLVDAHEELNYNHVHAEEIHLGHTEFRSVEHNMLHAQKRLISLQAVIALRMERLMRFTIFIASFSLIVAVVGLLLSLCQGCTSKSEQTPSVERFPSVPNPDLSWPVKYDVSKWDVATVSNATIFILQGKQSKDKFIAAQDIRTQGDSLFDAKFHADRPAGYAFRVRLSKENSSHILVISTTLPDSSLAVTAASAWGDDIIKKLKRS